MNFIVPEEVFLNLTIEDREALERIFGKRPVEDAVFSAEENAKLKGK